MLCLSAWDPLRGRERVARTVGVCHEGRRQRRGAVPHTKTSLYAYLCYVKGQHSEAG